MYYHNTCQRVHIKKKMYTILFYVVILFDSYCSVIIVLLVFYCSITL